MATLSQFQVSLVNASFIDSNTLFTANVYPDRFPDMQAVLYSSLFNLFNCPIGARGRIFEPEYGSSWYQFIQEWADPITASRMKVAMVQSIQRWEPRVTLIMNETYIEQRPDLPGFAVRLVIQDNISGARKAYDFAVKAQKS